MKSQGRILIIDDEVDICTLLKRFLERKKFSVETAYTGKQGLKMLKDDHFDLIISDFRLPDTDGLKLLKEIKSVKPAAPVIIITGYSDIRMAVEVIKFGAFDYVTKPLYPEELLNMVREALNSANAKDPEPTGNKLAEKSPLAKSDYISGKSNQAKALYKNMALVAPTPMSVLIQGETGTGKEFVAKELHNLSKRNKKPFVALDSGALPKDIAGSELFGHEKGAFTGASAARDGKFKLADGGTLFLDEIGNLSYEIQIKLLRVLQEHKFTRIGGEEDIEVDVRIIAATNENLKEAVSNGTFREDLFYRLNEFSLTIEPLRNRLEDLPDFAENFVAMANGQLDREVKNISDEVIEKFKSYTWPGNLRELKNVVKRAVLLTEGNTLTTESLPDEILFGLPLDSNADNDSLKSAANDAERDRIIKVLSDTGNNKSQAAKILNIDRKTLYNKLKLLDIDL